MKRKTLLSLLCAGVLTVGAVAGLTGFVAEDAAGTSALAAEAEADGYTLLTASDEANSGGEAQLNVEEVAAKLLPSVVSITNKSVTEVESLFGLYGRYGSGSGGTYSYETESVGSGIIIGQNDTELLICTNYHVVEDAVELSVGFVDDEIYAASVKGTDASIDLAVVAVNLETISEDTMSQISIAEIGNSDELAVGRQVVAIGNALGYGQSVTTGIVSALNRTIQLDTYTAEMIQTDAAINPGNSGGPLVDMYGRVIGINSAKASTTGVEGMGYAIPISDAQDILEELMNKKTRTEIVDESESAYIGISGKAVSDEMSSLYGIPEGIYITDITEGSPAEQAGLKVGYIITKFDSSSVKSASDLKEMLAYYAAGETVPVTVSYQENGEYVETTVELTLGLLSDYESDTVSR